MKGFSRQPRCTPEMTSRRCIVRNIPANVNVADVIEYFFAFRHLIDDISLTQDNTNCSRYAMITFVSLKYSQLFVKCLKHLQSQWNGHQIEVYFDLSANIESNCQVATFAAKLGTISQQQQMNNFIQCIRNDKSINDITIMEIGQINCNNNNHTVNSKYNKYNQSWQFRKISQKIYQFEFDIIKRRILLKGSNDKQHTYLRQETQIGFEDIRRIMISSDKKNELLICLSRPPRVVERGLIAINENRATIDEERVCMNKYCKLFEMSDQLSMMANATTTHDSFVSLCIRLRFIHLTLIPNYVIKKLHQHGFKLPKTAINDFNYSYNRRYSNSNRKERTSIMDVLDCKDGDINININNSQPSINWKKFNHEIVYLFQCLLSHNIIRFDHVNQSSFVKKFKRVLRDITDQEYFLRYLFNDSTFLSHGIYQMCDINKKLDRWIDWKIKNPNDYKKLKRKHVLKYGKYSIKPSKNKNFVKIIHITPLRILFYPSELIASNRVLRHFSKSDKSNINVHFACVSFVDENETRLHYSYDIGRRLRRIMKYGIKCLDGEKYQFLAYSNAQLRTQSSYFYHNNKYATCNSIRQWMGNFRNIKNVAKYSARMGLCFSAITGEYRVEKKEFIVIKDITRNGYTFTDGVGLISKWFATEIANKMGLKSVPSAFQFRFAGFKGVVVVYDLQKLGHCHCIKCFVCSDMDSF